MKEEKRVFTHASDHMLASFSEYVPILTSGIE
jgi:hypothetical protein